MGLALLFIIWLITLSSTYYFVIQKWAPLPVASANGVPSTTISPGPTS